MPEFTTISVTEAQIRTIPGRQGTFMNEYVDYIQQLPRGQAGKLTVGEDETHTTVRRRLATAAKAMNINLIIKRSGNDLYFWREDGGEEQPRPRRGRRPRTGRPGSLIPPDMLIPEPAEDRGSLPSTPPEAGEQERAEEETTAPDQQFSASEEVNHEAVLVEESPELGQIPV
jgi:hypothetical protein